MTTDRVQNSEKRQTEIAHNKATKKTLESYKKYGTKRPSKKMRDIFG